jgi:hypothetical protein
LHCLPSVFPPLPLPLPKSPTTGVWPRPFHKQAPKADRPAIDLSPLRDIVSPRSEWSRTPVDLSTHGTSSIKSIRPHRSVQVLFENALGSGSPEGLSSGSHCSWSRDSSKSGNPSPSHVNS